MRQEVCGGLRAYIANNTQVGFKLTPAYLAAVEIREPLNLCWRRREQPSNLNSIDFIIPSNVLRVLKVSSGSSSSITQPPPTRSLSLPPPATLYLKSTARLGRRANLCAISVPPMCAFMMRGDFRCSLSTPNLQLITRSSAAKLARICMSLIENSLESCWQIIFLPLECLTLSKF